MEIQETSVTAEDLAVFVDCGQYREANERALALQGVPDSSLQVLRAEIDIYYMRLDSAKARLESITDSLSSTLLGRFASVRGHLHYSEFRFEAADKDYELALHLYRFQNDELHEAFALYDLARVRRRRGHYLEANELLYEAVQLLDSSKDVIVNLSFLRGLIEFNIGICKHQLGDLEASGSLYRSAIDLLKASEGGRYYGAALNSYAAHLCRLGVYDEALANLVEAIDIFSTFGCRDELAAAMNNSAIAMIRLRRYQEAESLLTRAMELHQRTGNISFASLSLNLFADLYLSMGNLDLAYRFASEAYQQADLSGNRFDQAYANIRKGIVVLRGGGDDAGFSDSRDRNAFAVELLTRALELGKEIGSIELIAISTLYLAEAQIGLSVVKGRDLLKSARDLVTTYGDVCLVGELKRIEARYQGERMVVTGENCLSISGNFLPRIPAAKAELERFLIKNALEQAGQNQSEAGRLLGVSKAYIHQKRKQYGI